MTEADITAIGRTVDAALQRARDRAIARRAAMCVEIFRAVRAVVVIAAMGYVGFTMFLD